MSSCVKHPMTTSEFVCGECGHQFCPECVVFPFGSSKPPMCIACALELGGVRKQSTDRPKLSRKSIRARLAAQRRPSATDQSDEPLDDAPAPSAASVGSGASSPIGATTAVGSRAATDDAAGVDGADDSGAPDAWLDGEVDVDDVPGAWKARFD